MNGDAGNQDSRIGRRASIHAESRAADRKSERAGLVRSNPSDLGPARASLGPVHDSLPTITLQPAKGEATTLVLLHERLDDVAAAMPGIVDKVKTRWTMVFEKLALQFEIHRRRANASGTNA